MTMGGAFDASSNHQPQLLNSDVNNELAEDNTLVNCILMHVVTFSLLQNVPLSHTESILGGE